MKFCEFARAGSGEVGSNSARRTSVNFSGSTKVTETRETIHPPAQRRRNRRYEQEGDDREIV